MVICHYGNKKYQKLKATSGQVLTLLFLLYSEPNNLFLDVLHQMQSYI